MKFDSVVLQLIIPLCIFSYATSQEETTGAKKLLSLLSQARQETWKLYHTEKISRDCTEVKARGGMTSGIYSIHPPGAKSPRLVYCDQVTRGGGWTVLQNRFDGLVNFYRDWDSYKNGFGILNGEFWLGLEYVHLLTSFKVNELHVQLVDFDKTEGSAQYDGFYVDSEDAGYQISYLGKHSGSANDSLRAHTGIKFSTFDRDNDFASYSCAKKWEGAWWFFKCYNCHLNGRYFNKATLENNKQGGIQWIPYRGIMHTFKQTKMMIRPIQKKKIRPGSCRYYKFI